MPILVVAACFSEGDTPANEPGVDTTAATMSSTTAATGSADTTASTSDSTSPGQSGTSGDASTSVDSSSTTGPAPEDPYSPCFPFAFGGCDVHQQCAEGCLVNYENDTQVCTWGCGVAAPCPEPLSGDAPAVCMSAAGNTCVLDCSGGQACPAGMVCDLVAFSPGQNDVMACAWPTTEWRPPYSSCVEPGDPCSQCSLTQYGGSCASDSVPECMDLQLCPSVCLPFCGGELGDCPPSHDPRMPSVCHDLGSGTGACLIDCVGGECPVGMQCEEWNYSGLMTMTCMWPPP